MSVAADREPMSAPSDLFLQAEEAEQTASALLSDATAAIRARVSPGGKISSSLLDREQHIAHGLAWLATYVEIVRQLHAYAKRMMDAGRFGETERLLVTIGLGETLAQIFGGIPMNQGEFIRPEDFGVPSEILSELRSGAVGAAIASGNTAVHRARLTGLVEQQDLAGMIGDPGLDGRTEAAGENGQTIDPVRQGVFDQGADTLRQDRRTAAGRDADHDLAPIDHRRHDEIGKLGAIDHVDRNADRARGLGDGAIARIVPGRAEDQRVAAE